MWTEIPARDAPQRYRQFLSAVELGQKIYGGPVHWAHLIPRMSQAAGAVLLGLAVAVLADVVVGALLAALGALWGWLGYWVWTMEPIYFTSKRVIVVTGIIEPRVADMPLGKLTDMDFRRTPVGMLLGYGSFRLESAGQNQAVEHLRYVPDSLAAYRHLQNLLHSKGTQNVAIVDIKPRTES